MNNNRRFPRVRASTRVAHDIYHNNTYLLSRDIKDLFNCSPSTAGKIKRVVLEVMAERNERIYSDIPGLIDKDILFELAGLDITKIDKSYRELMRYENV
jgi:hypothetical protein|nr:MAG TPA: hypothetical protein [Caudoviricetes sp.]